MTNEPQNGGVLFLGWLMVLAGLGGMIYLLFFFDADVAVPENGLLVNNFGLLATKVCGMLASAAAFIVGAGMLLVNWLVKKLERPINVTVSQDSSSPASIIDGNDPRMENEIARFKAAREGK